MGKRLIVSLTGMVVFYIVAKMHKDKFIQKILYKNVKVIYLFNCKN